LRWRRLAAGVVPASENTPGPGKRPGRAASARAGSAARARLDTVGDRHRSPLRWSSPPPPQIACLSCRHSDAIYFFYTCREIHATTLQGPCRCASMSTNWRPIKWHRGLAFGDFMQRADSARRSGAPR